MMSKLEKVIDYWQDYANAIRKSNRLPPSNSYGGTIEAVLCDVRRAAHEPLPAYGDAMRQAEGDAGIDAATLIRVLNKKVSDQQRELARLNKKMAMWAKSCTGKHGSQEPCVNDCSAQPPEAWRPKSEPIPAEAFAFTYGDYWINLPPHPQMPTQTKSAEGQS
jgi:hypothetical protein